jgi:hypothetical protein
MAEYLLDHFKETEKKIRWDTKIENAVGYTLFELYIPKWRVPDPAPATIKVTLFFPSHMPPEPWSALAPEVAGVEPDLRTLPIVSHVKFHSDHGKTIQYEPIGRPDTWEIGSPYIPSSLLPDGHVESGLICVQWV